MPFWMGQSSLTALQWIARAATAYGFLLLMTKLMGQREMGQLPCLTLFLLSPLGALPAVFSSSETTLVAYVSSVAAFTSIHIPDLYRLPQGSQTASRCPGRALGLGAKRQILEDTMRKTRINLDDLMMQLRQRNYPNLADVEFAILETNGQISVIPKSQARPVTPRTCGCRLPRRSTYGVGSRW